MVETGIERLMKVGDVAKYLGFHEYTVRKMAREGTIPAKRIGERWRFRKVELEQWASGVVRSSDSGEGVANETGNIRTN